MTDTARDMACRFVTPSFVDFMIDGLTVVLVWIAAKLSKGQSPRLG
ncbi:MAG: hypothetical protein RSE12_17180 [Fuscovulum sp.]|nr:MAG: hypothetical protein RSE12_17180 [Fuscovulum sp.]